MSAVPCCLYLCVLGEGVNTSYYELRTTPSWKRRRRGCSRDQRGAQYEYITANVGHLSPWTFPLGHLHFVVNQFILSILQRRRLHTPALHPTYFNIPASLIALCSLPRFIICRPMSILKSKAILCNYYTSQK